MTEDELKAMLEQLTEARKQCEYAYQFHPSSFTRFALASSKIAERAVLAAIERREAERLQKEAAA